MSVSTKVKNVKLLGVKGRTPKTATGVLRRAKQILEEEGRWIKGQMWGDGRAEDLWEKPLCESWAVCSAGAVSLAAGEMSIKVRAEFYDGDLDYADFDEETLFNKPQTQEAIVLLAAVMKPHRVEELLSWETDLASLAGSALNVVTGNNDSENNRTKVLEWFDAAIKLSMSRTKRKWYLPW
jgi:hypothetical protein